MMDEKDIIFFDSETYLKKIYFKVYRMEGVIPYIKDHTHDYLQLWYVSRGAFIHSINNNKEYKMVKGDLFVMPPFVVHRVKPVPGEEVEIIGCEFLPQFISNQFENLNNSKDFFDFAYLEPFLVSKDMVRPKLNITGDLQVKVEDILEEMLEEYRAEDKYYDILLKGDLLRLMAIVVREYKKGYENSEVKEIFERYRGAIKASMKYIKQNYNTDLHLDDVCKHSMMSKTYFCYIFKNLTGKTFSEYLIDLRIQKSMDYLLNSDTSVTEICYKVGFNDVTHFCRMFKKIIGVSPKNYRNIALDRDGTIKNMKKQ